MVKHLSWPSYQWTFTKRFGKECYGTWRGEVLASAVTILFIYLINHNGVDVSTALLATAYTLAFFVLWHFGRTSWLLHQQSEEAAPLKPAWGFAGIAFALLVVVLTLGTAAWFYTMQPPVNLGTTHPDTRDGRIIQLEQQLTAARQPESPYSLRRRTAKLTKEVRDFVMERQQHHPPFAYPNSNDPNPSEETKRAIKLCQDYDQETFNQYMRKYKDRMVGIVREYAIKGVPTRYLENDFKQRVPSAAAIGSDWEGSSMDELSQFRDLAYHVDARDHLIVFSD